MEAEQEHRTKPWWDKAQAGENKVAREVRHGPLVLVTNQTNGTRLSAVSEEASKLGFHEDMKLNDARAMMPELRVEHHDIHGDHTLMNFLARWLLRYAPAVCIYDQECFILDTKGCDHLFGGELSMVADILKRFTAMGFSTRIAVCDTVAASLALTKYGADKTHVLSYNHQPDTLDALPVDALRLEDDTLILLKRLGLKRIGDVRVLPRQSLERRFRNKTKQKKTSIAFAQSIQWRLDQLSGSTPEPLSYIETPTFFRVTKPCPELALETGAISIALGELLPKLCVVLQKNSKGGRRFRLTGYRADGGCDFTEIRVSNPSHTPDVLTRLFRDRLEQINCGYGIDLFTLEALEPAPINNIQEDIIGNVNHIATCENLTQFSDTITNRFGAGSVVQLMPFQSHVPERSQRNLPISRANTFAINWHSWDEVKPAWSQRPLRLFANPEPANVTAELPDSPPAQFVWRKKLRRVIRARGPERIMSEWWHDDLKSKQSARFRDYYDVEDMNGHRYWIYRSIKDEQVYEDAYDENIGPETIMTIRWFVHGLF